MEWIWNIFCEDISKIKDLKGMTFNQEIVKGFLQAFGWLLYDDNLYKTIPSNLTLRPEVSGIH